jgi:hypothetical protein
LFSDNKKQKTNEDKAMVSPICKEIPESENSFEISLGPVGSTPDDQLMRTRSAFHSQAMRRYNPSYSTKENSPFLQSGSQIHCTDKK